jgi:hypothetical protein
MIDIKQFNEEKEANLLNTVLVFNQLYRELPETITELTYHELYTRSKAEHNIPLYEWKLFYTDKRIQAWYSKELELTMKAKLHKLTRQAGEDRSTATQQALQGLLKYISESDESAEDNKIFIYSHIPLTDVEEHLENVKIESTVPKEIANGLSIYTGDSEE